MKRYFFIFLLFLCVLNACRRHSVEPNNSNVYLRQVGDTTFDPKVDDPNFKVCNESRAQQYYNFDKGLQYKGEKPALVAHFNSGFKPSPKNAETGFVTIRFIVNCEGKTGWFRVLGIDHDYKPKKFSAGLVNQLLTLTKQLDGWIVGEHNEKIYDYYQYLTFKIENGRLIEIMP